MTAAVAEDPWVEAALVGRHLRRAWSGDDLVRGHVGRRPLLDLGASVLLDEVGGTSGPLIGLLFQEIARGLAAHTDDR